MAQNKTERTGVSVEKLETLMPLILESLGRGNSVTFSPMGVSMLPMLRERIDTVTVSPVGGRLKKYDLPLYRRENGKYVLHRVVDARESYTCIGDNQFVSEKGISQQQIIGVVTEFTRGERKHSVKEPGYKLYCRVWHYSRFPRRVFRAVLRRLKKL